MVSTAQGGSSRTTPTFIRIEREHNENPARFLVEDLTVDAGDGTSGELILARIRGIDSLDLVHAWEAVERNLANGENALRDEPRERVLDALEERRETLEEIGDRPERNTRRDDDLDSEAVQSVAVLVDEDGNEVPWSRQRVAGANTGGGR